MPTETFLPLSQTSRKWAGMATLGSNVYACVYTGGIYMQTGGTGDFLTLSQATRTWHGMTVLNNDVYACVVSGSIYKQTGGTGDFLTLNQTVRPWHGMATLGSNVYACEVGGGIYMQTGGTGDFISLSQTSRLWIGMTTMGNDVYACVYDGNIYKQTGGTGNFVSLNQTVRKWYGMTSLGNDIYATVENGDIYKQTDGVGDFVALGQTSREWHGMTTLGNNIYANAYNGDIYRAQNTPLLDRVDPSSFISAGGLLRIYGDYLSGQGSTIVTINSVDYSSNITSASSSLITMTAPNIAEGTYNLIVTSDSLSSSAYPITYSKRSLLEMPIRAPLLYQHYDNDDGTPVALGNIWTYAAGTSDLLATLLSDGVTEASNPVPLDAAGNANVYLKPGYSYKFIVKDALGVTISNGTQDNLTGSNSGVGSIASVENIAELELLSSLNNDYVTVLGYYAKTDNISERIYYLNSASTATPDGGSVIAASGGGNYILCAGKVIDVKWFGATGDGSTNDYTFISNAITYLVSIGGGVLQFSAGAYNFTSTLTIPATVEAQFLPGAYLKSTNTSLLTINKMNIDGLSKRFDSTIGTITLGNDVKFVCPEWFGAVGDGTTNDSAPIQKALDTHNKIALSRKTYKATTGLSVGVAREIIGNGATISPNANSINLIALANVDSQSNAIKITDLKITNGGSNTSVVGLYAPRCGFLTLENVYVESVETGFSIISGKNQTIKNITAKSCTKAGLSIKATGVEVYTANNFTGVNLEANACGLFVFKDSGNIKNVSFDGLILKDNTVNGAYFSGNLPVTLKNCWISGNGAGSATVTIDSQTVYKADLYLTDASVILKDSRTDSSLNNSIQLVSGSTLSHDYYNGYAGGSSTHFLVDATSKIFEGVITAAGYKENVWQYGTIESVTSPYICHGVGKSIQKVGRTFFNQAYPQTPNPTTIAPATEALFKTDKFLNYRVTFSNVSGTSSSNAAKVTFATGMSAAYQISTLLVRADTASAVLTFDFVDNSTTYTHSVTFSADRDNWKRFVFITAGKTSHEMIIYPPDTAGVNIYIADAMTWDGTLEAISEIYHECTVNLNQLGYYVSTAPTTGTWAKDDSLLFTDAVGAGYIGTVCTVAGTSGTWKSYGAVVP